MDAAVLGFVVVALVVGGIIGWLMVLTGSVLFFLSALGTPERFVPRWLTYLGRISFGLYMFHSLIFHLVFEVAFKRYQASLHISETILPYFGTALVLLLTILAAVISYAFFEKPFLKLKNRFTFVRSRPE